jgi:raffinose/stachyose/melibiose transport system permease protein
MSIRLSLQRTAAPSEAETQSAQSPPFQLDVKTPRQSFLRTRSAQGWLLSLPALILFGIFFIGPTIVGLLFSLTRWDGVTAVEFIGLSNYIELGATPRFWNDLVTNTLLALGLILIELPFALFLAIGLSKQNRRNNFFRTAFFIPQALSVTVAALTWRFAYAPSVGLINRILEAVGLGNLTTVWLGETRTALAALTLSFMWWTFGFFTILFIAGLSAIPSMYYEALRLESNRWYHALRHVTLPMLRETILIAFALAISNAFGHALGYVDLVTGGGPAGATELLGLYATTTALYGRRLGFSNAITFTMLAIVFAAVIFPIIYVARERLEFTE